MRAAKAAHGSPRHDDPGHHRGHIAHHSDSDQVGHIDRRAELLELHRAHEGEDYPHQVADQGDDTQGIRAALLNDLQQVRGAIARITPQEIGEGSGDRTQKIQEFAGRLIKFDYFDPDQFRKTGRLLHRVLVFFLGDRFRIIDQPREPLGQSRAPRGNAATLAQLVDSGDQE